MKTKICFFSLLLAFNVPAWAALYSFGTLNDQTAIGIIPDNSAIGTMNLPNLSFTASGLGASISDLTLTFVLQDGSASDLSGYLRLGNTDTSPYYSITTPGSEGSMTVNGTATTYTISFADSSSMQSAFNGRNPNDTWTLFFADSVPGDQTTLNGWSLDITEVPEPVNVALEAFGMLMGLGGIVRWRRSRLAKRGACVVAGN